MTSTKFSRIKLYRIRYRAYRHKYGPLRAWWRGVILTMLYLYSSSILEDERELMQHLITPTVKVVEMSKPLSLRLPNISVVMPRDCLDCGKNIWEGREGLPIIALSVNEAPFGKEPRWRNIAYCADCTPNHPEHAN